MRTNIRSRAFLAFTWALSLGASSDAAKLRLNGQQVEVLDPVKWAASQEVEKRDPSTGLPTGQRMHKPTVFTASAPPRQGSLVVAVPAGLCTVGATYPSVTLTADDGRVYRLDDVAVAGCSADKKKGSSRPVEEITFNYGKVAISYTQQ